MRRRLAGYARNSEYFKVGVSGIPEVRAGAYGRPYREMIVLYRTMSKDYVLDMESILVYEYWDSVDNLTGGGGGDVSGPPYYLYIVRG